MVAATLAVPLAFMVISPLVLDMAEDPNLVISEVQEIRDSIEHQVHRHKAGSRLRQNAWSEAKLLMADNNNDLTPRQIGRIAVTRALGKQ